MSQVIISVSTLLSFWYAQKNSSVEKTPKSFAHHGLVVVAIVGHVILANKQGSIAPCSTYNDQATRINWSLLADFPKAVRMSSARHELRVSVKAPANRTTVSAVGASYWMSKAVCGKGHVYTWFTKRNFSTKRSQQELGSGDSSCLIITNR